MPVYDIDLSDGRTITVEAANPPSEQDVLASLNDFQEPKADPMAMPSMQLNPVGFGLPDYLANLPKATDLFSPDIAPTPDLKPGNREPVDEIKPQSTLARFAQETGQAPVRLARMVKNKEGNYVPEAGGVNVTTGNELDQRDSTALAIPLPQDYLMQLAPKGKLQEIGAGLRNAAGNLVNFFLSPQGATVGGIQNLPPALQRTAAGYFAYDMAKHAPDSLAAGDEAFKRGDLAGAVEHWGGGVASLALSGLSARHAIAQGKPVPRGLEEEFRQFERGDFSQPQVSPDAAARKNLSLPPQGFAAEIPELQKTRNLIDSRLKLEEKRKSLDVSDEVALQDFSEELGNFQELKDYYKNSETPQSAKSDPALDTPQKESPLKTGELPTPDPTHPEVASQGTIETRKDQYGNPGGTTYHASPEDWTVWQQVTPATMENWSTREAIKNKYGGMPPEPPKGLSTETQGARGEVEQSTAETPVSGDKTTSPIGPTEPALTKGEQSQTPPRVKSQELLTPKEWVDSGNQKGTQWSTIHEALRLKKDVNAALHEQVVSGVPSGYVKDGDVYRPKDPNRPPSEMALQELTDKADEINQTQEILRKVESHSGGIFDPSGKKLEDLFSNPTTRKEVRHATEPHRELLRKKYGDTVKIYRGAPEFPKMTSPRTVFSWSLDKKIAEAHAKGRGRVIEREVPVDSILWYGNKHEHEVLVSNLELRRLEGKMTPEGLSSKYGINKTLADQAISAVKNLQKKLEEGFHEGDASLGIPKAILNAALDVVHLALKAGKPLADAIEAGIKHIRYNYKGKWNEKETRSFFESELGNNRVSPAGNQPQPPAGPRSTGRPTAAATPATVSPGRATGTQGAPAPGAVTPPSRTVDQTLAKVSKVFEPAPKTKTPLKQRAVNVVEAVRTGVSSKFRPLNKLAEDIAKAYGLTRPKDIAGLAEQLKGSQGKGEADIYRFDQDVSKLVAGSEKEFNDYMFMRRALDRLNQDAADIARAQAGGNVPTLNRRSVSDFTINELDPALAEFERRLGPEKLQQFKDAADAYQRHMDNALRLQVESGRMSREVYNAIKAGNQFYAPFKVMKYLEQTSKPEGTGAKIDTVADFTKAMEGIEDPDFKLGDMLGAARQSILLSRVLADKNMVMRAVAELAPTDTQGRFIKKLTPTAPIPDGMDVVNVLELGKQSRYAVPKDVAEALQLYGGKAGGLLSRFLGYASVPFRAGATALNLPFQVSNLLADVPRQALISRYGVQGLQDLVRYPMDLIQALHSSISGDVFGAKNKLFLDFLDSGVAGTTIQEYLTPEALKFKEPTAISKSTRLASTVLNVIPDFAKAIEQTSKIVGVKRAMRFEGVGSGKELAAQIPEAVTEIRRFSGSPDFGRMGSTIEATRLNLLYMFLNARIQGTIADVGRLSGRDGAKDAGRSWAMLSAAVGIPTVYLWLVNNSKDNKEDYNKRPLQERQNYWLIPKEDENGKPRYVTTEEGEKVRDYWRIPKRESSKWIANLTESAMKFAHNRDPKAAMEFEEQMVQEITPVNVQGDTATERLESVASSLNPAIKAPLELATGRDLYRHRELMNDQIKRASPEQQYTDRTPEAFRKLAELMPDASPEFLRSPIILENMTRNLTAGLVTQFLPRKPVRGREGVENNPLTQRFQSLPFTDSKEFQEGLEGLDRMAADEALIRHRAATKVIEDNPDKPPEKLVEILFQGKEPQTTDDVRLLKHMADLWIAKQNGATVQDRQIIGLPARQRALWVQQQISGLKGDKLDEKIMELARKKIFTKSVAEELGQLMQPQP